MRVLVLAVAALGAVLPACAEEAGFPGPYFGQVIRVIDGDTFEARIDIWPTVSATVAVRLRGYDAPELFRPACEDERYQGTLAKGAMEAVLPPGQAIALMDVGPDSFAGRVVADVHRLANVNLYSLDILLSNRDAVRPWNPDDPPIDWCKDASLP